MNSTLKCDRGLVGQLYKWSVRGLVSGSFAWSLVEFILYVGDVLIGECAEVGLLGDVLSDEAIEVLVGAPLPAFD